MLTRVVYCFRLLSQPASRPKTLLKSPQHPRKTQLKNPPKIQLATPLKNQVSPMISTLETLTGQEMSGLPRQARSGKEIHGQAMTTSPPAGRATNGRLRPVLNGRETPGRAIRGTTSPQEIGRATNGRLHQARSGREIPGIVNPGTTSLPSGRAINGRLRQARSGREIHGTTSLQAIGVGTIGPRVNLNGPETRGSLPANLNGLETNGHLRRVQSGRETRMMSKYFSSS